jgi:cyanophycinase
MDLWGKYMARLLVLTGGDEFDPSCAETDLFALNFTETKEKLILILPTAAEYELSGKKAVSNAKGYFETLGFESDCIPLYSRTQANNPSQADKLKLATHLYIVGGNPLYLLQTLKNTIFIDEVWNWLTEGNVLLGSSAGAMVLGSYMRNPIDKTWVEGLGIISGMAVLPHHENCHPDLVSQEIISAGLENVVVFGIDGKTSCVGKGSSWRVMGPGAVTVYNQRNWKLFRSGEHITDVG